MTFDPTEPVAPTATDTVAASEAAPRLAGALAKANGTVRLRLEEPEGANEPITVPATAFRLLVAILTEMARGNAVRVIPLHAELIHRGSRRAAERVVRPYVVRLLDEGQISSHKVGTHRRALFKDVMAYREEQCCARAWCSTRCRQSIRSLG